MNTGCDFAETLLHGLRLIGDDAVVETILSAIEILEKKPAEKTRASSRPEPKNRL